MDAKNSSWKHPWLTKEEVAREVTKEVTKEQVDAKNSSGKHLWLTTRGKSERPPIIAFSPEKLPTTLQGRPQTLFDQPLLRERKSQEGLLPSIQSIQRVSQEKMSGINNEKEEGSRSHFELPPGIPKMPGLIDLNQARAESKIATQSNWIPKRPAETLSSGIMEKTSLNQQSSLGEVTLKALLQQQPGSQAASDLSESRSLSQKEGSHQTLHQQLALRLVPNNKPPTASPLQRSSISHQLASRMADEQFRNRRMILPEEKKRKLSLSSGLGSSLSCEDEDDDDRPLVIDVTDDLGKKPEKDKRGNLHLGKKQSPVPTFHVTPLEDVKQEPWSFQQRPSSGFDQDVSYLTPMEDDDLDDLDSLDRVVVPSHHQLNPKRGNDPKPPEKVECPFCKRFYGKYYINKHMVDQHQ